MAVIGVFGLQATRENGVTNQRLSVYQRQYPDGIPPSHDIPFLTRFNARTVGPREWEVTLAHVNERLGFPELAQRFGIKLSSARQYVAKCIDIYRSYERDYGGREGIDACLERRTRQAEENRRRIEFEERIASHFDGVLRTIAYDLRRGGYTTPEAVRRATDTELLRVRNIGPLKLRYIRERFPHDASSPDFCNWPG